MEIKSKKEELIENDDFYTGLKITCQKIFQSFLKGLSTQAKQARSSEI